MVGTTPLEGTLYGVLIVIEIFLILKSVEWIVRKPVLFLPLFLLHSVGVLLALIIIERLF